jgi:hypothetical protein
MTFFVWAAIKNKNSGSARSVNVQSTICWFFEDTKNICKKLSKGVHRPYLKRLF